jgi:hypothetical protein
MVFSFHCFVRWAISVRPCLLIFHASECLRAFTTHVHRGLTGVIIEDFQAPAKAVAWDSKRDDVDLNLYLSTELYGRLSWRSWQRIRGPLKIDRNDFADSQRS